MVSVLTLSRLSLVLLSSLSLVHGFFTDANAYDKNSETPFQTLVSAPELKPPELLFTTDVEAQLADGALFMSLYGQLDSNQSLPSIFDLTPGPTFGTLIWTGLNYTGAWDFRQQTYKGKPHLTFFLGDLLIGYGAGTYYILDPSYEEVARFDAIDYAGLGDLHEFTITDDDSALILVYTPTPADLTTVNASADGWVFENIVQEVDIDTNELIFSWNASQHVAVNETFEPRKETGIADAPFDYCHLNSVAKDANGDYLVSARSIHAVFKVSGQDGHIIWRMGGKLSDFEIEPAAQFAFQHDARWMDSEKQDRMTIFDNGPHDGVDYSRGLLLAVDQDAKTVRLITEFKNADRIFNRYSGNMQALDPSDPETHFFVGFGIEPYFGEFSSNGTILLDGQFAATNSTADAYRSFKLPWQGKPSTNPDISWDNSSGEVFLSWNGATEHKSWVLYTADGLNASTWTNISAPVDRSGFEMGFNISAANSSTYIRASAVDKDGEMLGWTGIADGNGTVIAAPEPRESQLKDTSETTSTSSSSTASATSDGNASSPSSTDSGAAPTAVRIIEAIMAGVAVAALGGV